MLKNHETTSTRGGEWHAERAINEADAVLADRNGAIKEIRIIKDGIEFYVFLRLNWRAEELFLATTRTSNGPRRFKHLGRLIEYIEKYYPSINSIELVLKR